MSKVEADAITARNCAAFCGAVYFTASIRAELESSWLGRYAVLLKPAWQNYYYRQSDDHYKL